MASLVSVKVGAAVGWITFALSLVGCGSSAGGDLSKAEENKIATALNTHEDPRKHGVDPNAPIAPKKTSAEAQSFLEGREARKRAAMSGQHTGMPTPPNSGN